MSFPENICLGCMRYTDGAEQCPYCGHSRGVRTRAPFLQEGRDIGGRYVIGKALYSGGDGITYIAWDMDRGEKLYVREFLPDAIASRENGSLDVRVLSGCETVFSDCRAEFYKLWSKLSKLNGLSSLISVREVINDYGTVYAVVENRDFITLDEYLSTQDFERISWEKLKSSVIPLLTTVETLHSAGVLHGGISPQTVFVGSDGRFYLGRFCIMQARCAAADLNAELFDGYSAYEQYGMRQKPGTWTDVYALAALIYRCLTGIDPIPALQRARNDEMVIPAQIAQLLPDNVIDAVIDAFQIKPENRSVEVMELRCGLLGQEFRKKILPLSYYSYNDVSYVNQDKKPYVAQTEYFRASPDPPGAGAYHGGETKKPVAAKPPVKEENGKKGLIAFFIVVLLLAAVGAGFYIAYINGIFSEPEQTTVTQTVQNVWEVPDLVGRTDDSVRADAVLKDRFTIEFIQDYSLQAASGVIYAQSVYPGTQMATGSVITVYVSLGPKTVLVPDVIGINAEGARAQLEMQGLVVQINEKSNDGSGTQGFVASVSPDVGSEIKQGETVFVNVWGAPQTTTAVQTTAPRTTAGSNPGFSIDLPGILDLFG